MSDVEKTNSGLNPYSSPSTGPDDFAINTNDDTSTAALRAFVGPNADRYLKKWGPRLSGTRGKTGFNWAAFLFSGLWLGYRKMYQASLVDHGLLLVVSVGTLVIASSFSEGIEPPALDRIITLAIAIVCGGYGNRWYLAHAHRAIADARTEGLDGEDLLRALSRRGGTNLLVALGILGLYALAVFAASFLLAMIMPAAFE